MLYYGTKSGTIYAVTLTAWIQNKDNRMPWLYFKVVEEFLYLICLESSFRYNHICKTVVYSQSHLSNIVISFDKDFSHQMIVVVDQLIDKEQNNVLKYTE